MRFRLGVAVCFVAFVLLSCGSSTTTRVGRGHAVASDGAVALGERLRARPTEVTGRPSIVELGVKDPVRPARFVAIYGQADRDVAHLELVGPGSRRRSLPLSAHRLFLGEVGENITTEPYRTVRRRFGSPLKTLPKPGDVRCADYDIVGYTTGWLFCFRGEKMLSATGNQAAPRG